MHRLTLERRLAIWFPFLVACGAGLASRSALAQGEGVAAAQALFEQGRALLRAGKSAEACPKLTESQRIDPHTGTLLALALCHEAEGKLASAWAEFVSVEARARDENRPDRQKAAHEHARSLQPRLSTLEVRVPQAVSVLDGLQVRRNGLELGSGAWNIAVPVDGAEYDIEVTCPGKLAWKGSVTVKPEADVAVLAVPPLRDVPAAQPLVTKPPPTQPPVTPVAPGNPWGPAEWAGVSVAGSGVLALGVGGYFLATALGKNSDSKHDCLANSCGPQGFDDRSSAVSNGKRATLLGVVGGVLVAGGGTLFIVSRTRTHDDASPSNALSLQATGSGFGARFSGSW